MRRLHVLALLCLLLGGALTAAGAELRPRDGDGGDPRLWLIERPSFAEYDARNGTTLVASDCWACAGQVGYVVAGDARWVLDERRVYLRAPASDPHAMIAVEPQPLEDDRVLTRAYAGPFEPADVKWRLGTLLAGLALLAAAPVGLARAPWTARAALPLALTFAVVAVGGWIGTTGGNGFFLLVLLAPLPVGAAVAAFWRGSRPAAFAVIWGYAIAWLGMMLVAAYYPAGDVL